MPTPSHRPDPDPDRQPHKPAADHPAGASSGRARRARPGPPGFTFQVQLVGGEEGRRLEQQQAAAILEALRWLAAHPPTTATRSAPPPDATTPPTAGTATTTATNAGTRTSRDASDAALPSTPTADRSDQPDRPHTPHDHIRRSTARPYPAAVRVQAVGLVGTGQPLGVAARARGVHPAALRRWVWQAWRHWAAAAGLPDPTAPAPSFCPDEGQKGAP